jgi:hypothetical protein
MRCVKFWVRDRQAPAFSTTTPWTIRRLYVFVASATFVSLQILSPGFRDVPSNETRQAHFVLKHWSSICRFGQQKLVKDAGWASAQCVDKGIMQCGVTAVPTGTYSLLNSSLFDELRYVGWVSQLCL